MTDRQQIEDYLKDIPSKWRTQLSEIICKIKDEVDCDKVHECETVTALSDFTVDGGEVSITYTDEKLVNVTRTFDISEIINNSLDGISPNCITSQPSWDTMTYAERIQALIDSHCDCCGI